MAPWAESIHNWVNRRIDQSEGTIIQSIDESINQSINQSIEQWQFQISQFPPLVCQLFPKRSEHGFDLFLPSFLPARPLPFLLSPALKTFSFFQIPFLSPDRTPLPQQQNRPRSLPRPPPPTPHVRHLPFSSSRLLLLPLSFFLYFLHPQLSSLKSSSPSLFDAPFERSFPLIFLRLRSSAAGARANILPCRCIPCLHVRFPFSLQVSGTDKLGLAIDGPVVKLRPPVYV